MRNMHRVITGKIVFMVVTVSSLVTADAGRVDVVNENNKGLKIRLEAEGNQITEQLATYIIKDIPAEHFYTFIVEASDLKGKSHYSIKGDTSAFTPGDKCKHLSVEKNYRVTFINDTIGTTCTAEEVS